MQKISTSTGFRGRTITAYIAPTTSNASADAAGKKTLDFTHFDRIQCRLARRTRSFVAQVRFEPWLASLRCRCPPFPRSRPVLTPKTLASWLPQSGGLRSKAQFKRKSKGVMTAAVVNVPTPRLRASGSILPTFGRGNLAWRPQALRRTLRAVPRR